MEFNFSDSGTYTLPSWQESFSAPSVIPGVNSSPDFSVPSFNAFDYVQSYGEQPASSNWMDYLKTGGLALSAAGDAIRAFRGEPIPPGSSPFQNYLAQEEQKESDKRLAQLLKDAMGPSSTDAIEGVLDPAAERRERGTGFGSLPSLAGIGSSRNTRMAGSFLS